LRTLVVEVLGRSTHKDKAANPCKDSDCVLAVCLLVRDEDKDLASGGGRGAADQRAVILVDPAAVVAAATGWVGDADGEQAGGLGAARSLPGVELIAVGSEEELFRKLVEAWRRIDPDVVVSWEMQREGLGFLLDRADRWAAAAAAGADAGGRLEKQGRLEGSLSRALSRAPWGVQNRMHRRGCACRPRRPR
jgi:hypothetical protein